MIIVKVELWSAIDGQQTELARMVIDNIGGTKNLGDYRVRTLRGRSNKALAKAMNAIPMKVQREGRVFKHPRLKQHVWNLVAKALGQMEYGND